MHIFYLVFLTCVDTTKKLIYRIFFFAVCLSDCPCGLSIKGVRSQVEEFVYCEQRCLQMRTSEVFVAKNL